MRIDRIRWSEWEAVRCTSDHCEMVVGVSAGPRILSFRRGLDPNLLYQDTTQFCVGDWLLHGGHRFTVAPEGDRTYEPDNLPCSVLEEAEQLRVAAAPGRDGTHRVLLISPACDGVGFDVHHLLENHGERAWRGALWGITCVPTHGTVVAPRGNSRVRYWPGPARDSWKLGAGYIAMTPNGTRGKAGWHCAEAWLASLQQNATFVIHSPSVPPRHECVDDGCNLEVFTCADYVELETLSGVVTLEPGESATHLQRWRWLPPVFLPKDWAAIGESAGCDSPRLEPHYVP